MNPVSSTLVFQASDNQGILRAGFNESEAAEHLPKLLQNLTQVIQNEPGRDFLLALVWLKRAKAPVLVYCLMLPLLVAVLQLRAIVRPELISYAFIIISLLLYERARTGVTVWNMLPIVLLIFIWTNYHSSIFGYIIFFGLFIDLGIMQWTEHASNRTWINWLGWGLLVVAVGFLNPSISHPLVASLTFADEWKIFIAEYKPPVILKHLLSVYVLGIAAIITLALTVHQRLFGYFVVCAVLMFYSLTMGRVVTPASIVVLCVFSYTLSRLDLKSVLTAGATQRRRAFAGLAILMFLLPVLSDVRQARGQIRENLTLPGYFPVSLVDYMKDEGYQGRIFNEYEMGGYLIYRLAPDSSVYIDGRTDILYPVEHYVNMLALKQSPSDLRAELEKYDIQYSVLKSEANNAKLMSDAGLMKLDFADGRYFLYRRGEANFPVSGMLWGKPYCWNESQNDALAAEQVTALQISPPTSRLVPFLVLANNYASAQDKSGFLKNINITGNWTDTAIRFVAYRAIENDLHGLAQHVLEKVKVKEPKDYTAKALAELRAGHPEQAEKTIDGATRIRWEHLDFVDLVIMQGLLTEIREMRPLELIDDEYLQGMTEQVGEFSLPAKGEKVSVGSFCEVL